MVNNYIDYTNLKQTATKKDIEKLIDEAIENKCASVCIPPCYVKYGTRYAGERIKICTVIGFPNGYSTTWVKATETFEAIENGAKEIDMVININCVKNKEYEKIEEEIKTLAGICHVKRCILKVIIETCLLTDEEIIEMCKCIVRAGGDFIKTSTGFSTGGADERTVALIKKQVDAMNECGSHLKIKASGGIRTEEDAKKFIELGADRLGCSKIF